MHDGGMVTFSSPAASRDPAGLDHFTWGTLSAGDADAWSGLLSEISAVEEGEEEVSPALLTEELRAPSLTPEQDTWAVWDGDRLVAYALVYVPGAPDSQNRLRCGLLGAVHPGYRRRGIGTRLLDLTEARAAESAAERHPEAIATWAVRGRVEGHPVRELLTPRGYEIGRYFHEMTVALPPAEVNTQIPPGFTLRGVQDEDQDRIRVAHNDAFRDHWGSAPSSITDFAHFWHSGAIRLDLSRVVLDADDEVVAYTVVGEYRSGIAYIELVGTVRRARGRGLARACLSATLMAIAEAGEHSNAELHVDSVSPTGATRLYEMIGFKIVRTVAAFQRTVPVAG